LRRLGLKHLVQVSLTSKEWRIQTRRLGREVIKREAGKGLHLFDTPDSLLQFSSLDSYWSTVFANFAWHFAISTTSISSVFSAAGLPDFFSLYYAASTFLPPYHTAGYLRFIAVFFSCYTFLAVAYLMWYLDKTRTYFLWLFYNIDCIQWRTRRGGRPLRRLKKFRANSIFRASSSCSKILKDKKSFNTVKNFRTNAVFRASAGCSKFWMIKNLNTVNSGHSLFFRESTSCSKIMNVKLYSIQWKFSGKTLFSEQAQVPQKSLYQCSKNFQGKLCFLGQAQFVQNSEG